MPRSNGLFRQAPKLQSASAKGRLHFQIANAPILLCFCQGFSKPSRFHRDPLRRFFLSFSLLQSPAAFPAFSLPPPSSDEALSSVLFKNPRFLLALPPFSPKSSIHRKAARAAGKSCLFAQPPDGFFVVRFGALPSACAGQPVGSGDGVSPRSCRIRRSDDPRSG